MNLTDRLYLEQRHTDIIKNCKKCHGRSSKCTCAFEYRVEINKITSGIPLKYREFSVDMLTHPQIRKPKQEFIQYLATVGTGNAQNLFIYGSSGMAKSSCACAVLTEALRKNKSAYYFMSPRIAVNALTTGIWDREQNKEYSALIQSDYIAIDNIGAIKLDDNKATELFIETMQNRAASGRYTIFISDTELRFLPKTEQDIVTKCNPTQIRLVGFDYNVEVLEKVKAKKSKKGTKNG
jgi:DNA replication protein DnaC